MERDRILVLAMTLLLACATPSHQATEQAKDVTPAALPAFRIVDPAAPSVGQPSELLAEMSGELARSVRELSTRGPLKPYYLAYDVIESSQVLASASFGSLTHSSADVHRALEVDLRVGDKHLDNSHQARTDEFAGASFFHINPPFPIDPVSDAVRATLWAETDRHYKEAIRHLEAVRADHAVKAEEEDISDDFSDEPPSRHFEPVAALAVDRKGWEERVRRWSATFRAQADVYDSSVHFQARQRTRYFVSSDGSQIVETEPHYRISVFAETRAEDGEDLRRVETFDAASLDRLPTEAAVQAKLAQVGADLRALRRAPVLDPFTGPAILEGRAAGVFFHETLGHRLEGHRQKRDVEGQTFAKKRGERVMSALMDVFDDPRISGTDTYDLNGHYRFDDEGVPAQRALLVEGGVLRTFLMSRSPTHGVVKSNGHGRREAGFPLVARQANLVVAPRATVAIAELRRMLLAEAAQQGKSYGLLFRELEGGFTDTMRFGFQGFKVLPVMVYRVYVDGRPDELVRGADIVGTPLATLNEIVAAADDYATFNGYCGAESGPIPVSATAPSLLIRKIEVARKFKGDERPPFLEAPGLTPSHSEEK